MIENTQLKNEVMEMAQRMFKLEEEQENLALYSRRDCQQSGEDLPTLGLQAIYPIWKLWTVLRECLKHFEFNRYLMVMVLEFFKPKEVENMFQM